ncbi:hypothetical protein [Colwellia psychrerythraea]|uniref:hypothetical protein n=1 Tax=Colwellia psychrerythraea TaxID=28229 RepID=UPI00051A4AEF|nr:hypothetical protein [Colwellia psychrerythraea]
MFDFTLFKYLNGLRRGDVVAVYVLGWLTNAYIDLFPRFCDEFSFRHGVHWAHPSLAMLKIKNTSIFSHVAN